MVRTKTALLGRRALACSGLGILALGAIATCRPSETAAPLRPVASTRGYVLISIDTLRADHLGLYGYRRPTSPFLDRLGARATVFDNAIVQVPGTLPSHMCMFTGLYPPEHGVYPPDAVLSAQIPTLPEVFRQGGFRTAGFTEGGYVAGRFGFARGFDEFNDQVAKQPDDVETTFRRGVGFLESIRPEQRFFLFLHTYVVHDPYTPPARYRSLFADGAPPPDAFAPTGPNFVRFNLGNGTISPAARQYYEALYDADVRYADDVVNWFFAELARLGLADETTVVITSDHGEEFLEHGKMVHEQVYHELLHVPLLIVHPDPATRARIEPLVQSIDIAPTLYALAGIDAPPRISGQSLVPYLAGRHEPLRAEAYAEAFVTRDRAIYRAAGSELHHLIVRRPGVEDGSAWVSRAISFDWPGGAPDIAVRAFHQPRTVRISLDEQPLTEVALDPSRWTTLPLAGVTASPLRHVGIEADGCVAPSSVSNSSDDRCLAFQIRGTAAERRELYDVRRDRAEARDVSHDQAALVRELEQALDAHAWHGATPVREELDPALRERLRALGYRP
jgi:arylsulfatase A-like enzyme